MGLMTRAEIVSTALNLAGNTGLTTQANTWLEMFLTKLYASARWPYIEKEYGPFTLAQAATGLVIGDGTNATEKLVRINRVVIADTVNNGWKADLDMGEAQGTGAEHTTMFLDTASGGVPSRAVVSQSRASSYTGPFRWLISVSPVGSKAYRLGVWANVRPAVLEDGHYPAHPNDETLVQAVYVQALRHQQDERLPTEQAILGQYINADRVTYGGHPQKLQLSPARFARRR